MLKHLVLAFALLPAPLALAQSPAPARSPAPTPSAAPAASPSAAPRPGSTAAARPVDERPAKLIDARTPAAGHATVVDLNTATPDELKRLPGVTDEIAAKIVAGRPYRAKDQLLKQKVVDAAEYGKIRPLVIARQPKKRAAPVAPAASPAPTK